MPLRYDPKDVLGWVPQPGSFPFRVLSCSETVFKTGSSGVRLELEVDAEARSALRCWDNIVFGHRTTWKMYDLCMTAKVRFDPPCEASDLIGKTGCAEFKTEDFDDFVNLKVVRYLHDEPEAAAALREAPKSR